MNTTRVLGLMSLVFLLIIILEGINEGARFSLLFLLSIYGLSIAAVWGSAALLSRSAFWNKCPGWLRGWLVIGLPFTLLAAYAALSLSDMWPQIKAIIGTWPHIGDQLDDVYQKNIFLIFPAIIIVGLGLGMRGNEPSVQEILSSMITAVLVSAILYSVAGIILGTIYGLLRASLPPKGKRILSFCCIGGFSLALIVLFHLFWRVS